MHAVNTTLQTVISLGRGFWTEIFARKRSRTFNERSSRIVGTCTDKRAPIRNGTSLIFPETS